MMMLINPAPATRRETRFQDASESLAAARIDLDGGASLALFPYAGDGRPIYQTLDLLYALDGNPIPAPPPDWPAHISGASVVSSGTESDYAEWAAWLSEVAQELDWRGIW